MYHSITIGTDLLNPAVSDSKKVKRNTWDDWHLIPTSRPLVNPPTPNINRISIPGGDGTIDLTEILAGRPTYSDRSGSWSFYVENGFLPWSYLYSEIMRYLHGRQMQCVLEDDPLYYYEGRFSVNEWRSDAARSMITINYILSPYKMYNNEGENWVWDTFYFGDSSKSHNSSETVTIPLEDGEETKIRLKDFDNSVGGEEIQTFKDLKIESGQTRTINLTGNYEGATISVYTNSANMTLTYKGTTYKLSKNSYNHLDDIVLSGEKTNKLEFAYTRPAYLFDDTLVYNGAEVATFSIYISGGML